MDDGWPQEVRLHRFERLEITVEDFTAQGYILDVGGGGEGSVGRLKDIAAFPLLVHLPGETVETSYGVRFPQAEECLPYYVALAEGAGFQVAAQADRGRAFFLELCKP